MRACSRRSRQVCNHHKKIESLLSKDNRNDSLLPLQQVSPRNDRDIVRWNSCAKVTVKSDGVVFLPFVETSSVMASGTGTCLVL